VAVQTDDVRAGSGSLRLPGPLPPSGVGARSTGRRAALDGVRGLAIALVVVHHFTQGLPARPRGGFLGVDLFFVLSGYLITGLLVRARERTGRVGLVGFWLRRARRLLPPLLLVVAALSALSWWAFPPATWPGLRSDALSALLYTANVHELGQLDPWGRREGPALLMHMWSLAVEEQFYLAWPLVLGALLAAGHRLGRLRLPALWVSVAGGLVSFAWMTRTWLAGSDAAYYDTRARAGELLAGGALALVLPAVAARLGARSRSAGSAAAAAGLAVLAAAVAVLAQKGNAYFLGGALVVALAAVLVIGGVEVAPDGAVARALGRAPLVGLGRISYTLYLVHFPVMGLVPLPDAGGVPPVAAVEAARLCLSLGLAVLSYRLLERPLLAGTLPWVGRSRARLGASALVAAAATMAVVLSATTLPGALADGLALPAPACPGSPADRFTTCDAGSAGGRWVVTGDESAANLGRALAAVPGVAVTRAAWTGCGAGGLGGAAEDPESALRAHLGADALCARDAVPLVAAAVAAPGATALVVADATSSRAALPAAGDSGWALPGSDGHDEVVRTALLRLVDLAAARGVRTVLVRQPPPTAALGPLVAAGRPAGLQPPLTPVTGLLERYDGVLTEVAALRPAWVRLVAVDDLVCPGGGCPAVLDGVLVRRTPREFTTAFAARLAPELAARVRAALTPPRRAG
jgi:peptidoglycan/LPS O-acetylase OafA/YrhL